MQEGGISPKERALLVRLRDSLGVSPADADALERELQEHPPSVTWLWSALRRKAEVHLMK
jgi:hypothetical protein